MTDMNELVALDVPDDLRPWGYAPGFYTCRCIDCPAEILMQERAMVDKRAWRCKEHAIAAWSKRPTEQIAESANCSRLAELAALDKAATQGVWQADGYDIRLLDGSPWAGDEKANVAFMASLVNAYRSGDLVPRADGDVVAWIYERNGEVVLLNERLRGNVLRSVTGWAETALATATALATVQADLARVTAERDALRQTLHDIDVEAGNTIRPDGRKAAFSALGRIVQLINPHRMGAPDHD